jgi:hypothetical protein
MADPFVNGETALINETDLNPLDMIDLVKTGSERYLFYFWLVLMGAIFLLSGILV